MNYCTPFYTHKYTYIGIYVYNWFIVYCLDFSFANVLTALFVCLLALSSCSLCLLSWLFLPFLVCAWAWLPCISWFTIFINLNCLCLVDLWFMLCSWHCSTVLFISRPYVYIYTHTHTHTYVYTYVYMYACISPIVPWVVLVLWPLYLLPWCVLLTIAPTFTCLCCVDHLCCLVWFGVHIDSLVPVAPGLFGWACIYVPELYTLHVLAALLG